MVWRVTLGSVAQLVIGPAFLALIRAFAYHAWQDRRGNTDYDIEAVDAGEFREWFDNVLAQATCEDAALDIQGVCLMAWRYSNHRWGDLDDPGFVAWWAANKI